MSSLREQVGAGNSRLVDDRLILRRLEVAFGRHTFVGDAARSDDIAMLAMRRSG